MFNFKKSLLTAALLVLPSVAFALPFDAGLTPIGGATWNNIPTNSTDPVGTNAYVGQLAPYVEQQAYRMAPTFNASSGGTTVGGMLMLEIAAYAPTNTLYLCSVGSPDACTTLFTGSDAPGAVNSIALAPGLDYYFSLLSPAGTWYSDASRNVDSSDHFVVFKVNNSGNPTVSPTNINGTGSVSLSLIAGISYLVGVEDLPIGQRYPNGGGDRDFNDMMFEVKVREVPEPASLALLGLGALVFPRRRRSA